MNELLPYRKQPLSDVEFKTLEHNADKFFTVKPRMIGESVPVADAHGDIYRWEWDMIPDGTQEIAWSDTTPPEQLMEALTRPATKEALRKHLFTLSRMKKYTAGDVGFRIVANEIMQHLENCSEYALKKICHNFALDTESPFFPDPAKIIAAVKNLQDQLKQKEPSPAPVKKTEEPAPPKPTNKQKRRVVWLVKLAMKPRGTWSKWEERFYKATRGKNDEKRFN